MSDYPLTEKKTCKYCDQSYLNISKHEKRCEEVFIFMRQFIRNMSECIICQKSYPFIRTHLFTKHGKELSQIQRSSVSMIRIDLGKMKVKNISHVMLITTKTPEDQSIYGFQTFGKQMDYRANLEQREDSYLRRQSLLQVSYEEKENAVPDLHRNQCQHCKRKMKGLDQVHKIRHEIRCAKICENISGKMCKFCKLSFASFDHVYEHIRVTHRAKLSGGSNNQCQYCKKILQGADQVKDHLTCAFFLKYVRGQRCLVCNLSSQTHESAKTHVLDKHNELYSSLMNVMNGITLPHREEHVECKQASEEINEQDGKMESFNCNKCPRSFQLRFELAIHSKKYHQDNPIPNENVGLNQDLDSYRNHCLNDTVQNNTLQVSNACRFCKKQFSDRGNKIRHETLCAKISPKISGTMCTFCGRSYASFHHAYQHIKSTHRSKLGDEGRSRRQCQYCKKIFRDVVEAHEATCPFYLKYVRGQRCLVCNFSFPTHTSAKDHARNKHNDLFNSFMNGITLPEKAENVENNQETNNEETSMDEKVNDRGNKIRHETLCPKISPNECPDSFELRFDDSVESKGGQPESVSQPNSGIEIIDLEDDSSEVSDEADEAENVESKQETNNEKANMVEKVKAFGCNECPKSFELRFELAMHSKKHHCDNATPLKKLQIRDSFSQSHIKRELGDEKDKVEDTDEPKGGQPESVSQSNSGIEIVDLEDDSGEVTKLYMCPYCQSKWLHLKKAQNHIVNFHHIPIELQSQFGITIKEIIV